MKKYIITALITATVLAFIPMFTENNVANAADDQTKNETAENQTDTISCIGSVSKMFVTTAAMQLAEDGKLDLDAPVTDYIPEFHMSDERYKNVTVRMLMNHSSGLMGTTSKNSVLFDDRDISYHDKFIDSLSSQKLKADPGDYSTYCNDGFTLLEHVVERVSRETLTDYISNHICTPLNLQQTGTPWNMFQRKEHAKILINGNVRFATDYCMAIGSGGIISTANDLCTFGSSFFKGDNSLLSERSKAEMSESQVKDKYEDGFGLGWDSVDSPDYSDAGVKVVSKGGDIVNQHAQLIVAPDEKISVAVLSAGGDSTLDDLMAKALMDIALSEKGITVNHDNQEEKKTLEQVPERYLKYEDIYVSGSDVCKVSFPEKKYMEIKFLSGDKNEIKQYMYTADDTFVLMDGKIQNGNAVQDRSHTNLIFKKRKGIDFICMDTDNNCGSIGSEKMSCYYLQRVGKNPVSDDVLKSWEDRNGRKYYLCSSKYSSSDYTDMVSQTIKTYKEAKGYVSSYKMTDKNNADNYVSIPGFAGRDLSRISIRTENGNEYLTLTDKLTEYISEDAISELTESIREVKLKTKEATWFRIGESMSGSTITLEIPQNSAVYVYDQYDKITYSSYMKDYGISVTLPSGGKIVFLGEDNNSIKIS